MPFFIPVVVSFYLYLIMYERYKNKMKLTKKKTNHERTMTFAALCY